MEKRLILILLMLTMFQQDVLGARIQGRAAYSRSVNEPWTTTEGELASQATATNVIAWLDRAAHSHVIEALSSAGARMTEHGPARLQHWEF
ncbi:g3363 [Coccomyxa elongata]